MRIINYKVVFLIIVSILASSGFAVSKKSLIDSNQIAAPQVNQEFTMTEISDPKIFAFFTKLLPATPIDKIYSTPYKNVYAVQAGENLFYGQIGSSFLVVGHMFNPYNQQDLTTDLENLKLANTKVDISKLNIDNAIVVKGNDNKSGKKIIIFEDPDCPYCRVLEQQLISSGVIKKLDIYKILIPLSMHPNARKHVSNIYCAKAVDKNEILENYMVKGNDNQHVELKDDCSADKIIEQNGELARKYNVTGTPTIILGNGKLLQGTDVASIMDYVNAQDNKQKLKDVVDVQ